MRKNSFLRIFGVYSQSSFEVNFANQTKVKATF
jgi:hypothetical protein